MLLMKIILLYYVVHLPRKSESQKPKHKNKNK
jgi:hypothetical protein